MRIVAALVGFVGVGLVSFAGTPASAKTKKLAPLVDESADGTLATLTSDGRWRATADCTVTLVCRPDEAPSDSNEWLNACTADVRVQKNGKTIAKQKDGQLDINWKAVGGNNGSLSLALFPVGELQLVMITQTVREGDESSRATTTEQLLIVDGDVLREVFRHDALTENEPGPDGPESERTKTTETLTVGKMGAKNIPELVVTSQTDRDKPEKTTLVWDGKSYAVKAVVLPPPAPLVDEKTGKSIEAQLGKIFAGQPLDASAVVGLSPPALNLLRNAIFARHGRPFKRPELQAFFYAPRPKTPSPLLPRTVNPKFSDALLDANDKRNLSVLQAAEKKRP